MKLFPLLGLLFFIALPWRCALADQGAFQSGISAFQAGDLDRARRLLEQARDSGMTSPALRYNLGVVYFRLGLYEQAETAFTALLDGPHAPLARYNLGLVMQQKGDPEGAYRWFSQAAGESSPEEIQALAQRQLANADHPPIPGKDLHRTVGFVSAVLGYDNNIADTPSGAGTDQAGPFADWLASGRVYLDQPSGSAVRLDAVAYTRRHPGNAEFDSSYLGVGVAWQPSRASARLVTGVTLSRFWFGGDLLEQQLRLDLTYDRPGCFWPHLVLVDCKLEGFASTLQGGPGFSAYDGRLY
ncbi:MAG TPA: tetratricopeptide repeat protein, partial [Desulfurivibrionaceae bacterium]|nr:tetratricopeptide repeat protein [Desulfurivibrionaceae bacterium]